MRPDHDIVQRLKRGALRDLEDDLHRIYDVELERPVLFAHDVQLEELVAQLIPDFLELVLQGRVSGVPPDLPADPERGGECRAHVRDAPQAIDDADRQLVAITLFYLHRVAVANVHGED